MWLTLIGLSIFTLIIFRIFPGDWLSDDHHLNSIVSYLFVGVIFYAAIYLLGLPSLKYFGLPKVRMKAIVAIAISFPAPILQMKESGLVYSSWVDLVSGWIFLLMIGFGEEMLSRGFTYGVLLKFGQLRAIFFSSLFFGLLHINLYFPDRIGWDTYYHVFSTFGFGLVMCGLMIATKSIWVPVVYHAMMDWHIPFQPHEEITDDGVYSLWENITGPFFSLAFDGAILLILLGINAARMPSMPRWFEKLALRWKLIEVDPPKIALVGEN